MNLVVLLALVQAFTPPPLRVYFVGNSLTFRNDLPGMVVELGGSLDRPMQIKAGMTARDGMSLERHWSEGEVLRRLREEDWDVLVLQEQSSRLLADPAQTERYLRLFAEVARENGTEVVLLQTWVRADMSEAHERQRESYRKVAKAVNVRLAPIGEAWSRAQAELPGVALHHPDGLHASRAGTYLTAAVLVGMLAARPLEPARPLFSGDPESAGALRTLAWRIVSCASVSQGTAPRRSMATVTAVNAMQLRAGPTAVRSLLTRRSHETFYVSM